VGPHVVAGTGPGGTRVYRMCHARVAAHLRGEPPAGETSRTAAPDTDAGAAWRQHRTRTEGIITAALLATVPAGKHGRDWARAHPYLRAYLARHAAAAGPGTFTELIADRGFLAVADPQLLIPLMSLAGPGARDIVCTYRRAFPLLGEDPRGNAAHLQEAAWARGRPAIDTQTGAHPRYRTVMASVRRDDSLLTMRGHASMVYSVAFGTDPGGRLLLASGGDDGTIRLWDPLTGTPTHHPITGHGDRISGPGSAPWGQRMKPSETYWTSGAEVERVVFGTAKDGRFLLASAGCDRTVRIWDPLTGAPVGDVLTGHTGRIWCLAAAHAPDGRLLLASGGDDLTVRIWDPLAGTLAGAPLTGHTDQVVMTTMATTVDGRLLLATASSDGTVRLWDPLAGTSLGEPLTGHDGPVFAVAFGTPPDGRLLLVSAGEDATVRLWDPLTGAPIGRPMTGHTDRVDGLAFGTASGGRWLLASSSRDQTIRLWDPLAGTPVGEPLVGHTSWVFELACGTAPDGRLLLASASADTTIKIWTRFAWNLPVNRSPGTPLGDLGGVRRHPHRAVAAGQRRHGQDRPAVGPAHRPARGQAAHRPCRMDRCAGIRRDPGRKAAPRVGQRGSHRAALAPRQWACLTRLRRGSPLRAIAAADLTLALGDDNGVTVIELAEEDLPANRPLRVTWRPAGTWV
jgi:WD40 repeat protein